MNSKYRKILVLMFAWGIAWVGIPVAVSAEPSAVLTVDASRTLASFIPLHIFGNNVAYWVHKADNLRAQPKVEAAGNYLLRYPGGSASDDYHWNGTGKFDAGHHWVPSGEKYTPGFAGDETYRGTSSSYGIPSHLTDGKEGTAWKSCVDTDFPRHQWVYVDLTGKDSPVEVNAVTLVWGKPYASSFQVQCWKGSNGWPSPYQSAKESDWVTTSAGTLSGVAGTQGVTFRAVKTRYLRVLMTKSSAGKGGAYSIAELYAANGNTRVTKNQRGMGQSATAASSTDPACSLRETPDFDFESYMAYLRSFQPHATPMITVNFGTGNPQEAAAWVRYANKVKGYGIKYWEIGNELDGDWETGGPLNAKDYARRYIKFYEAMKAEDPSILVGGPVASQPEASSAAYDGKTFIEDFLQRLAKDPGGSKISTVDALSYHWYPFWANNNAVTTLSTPSRIKPFQVKLDGWLREAGASARLPVWLTEFNSGGSSVQTVQLLNGLWFVNWMGEFIRHFGTRGFTNIWDVLNGGGLNDPKEGDHAYLQAEKNPYQYQERAHYWAMQMMARDWAIAGDARKHKLVSVEGKPEALAAYADRRPDGVLSLIVVNKDPAKAYPTSIHLKGFTPAATAKTWTFDSSNYVWETSSRPYHAAPDKAPTEGVREGVSKSFPVTLKPYSIMVFQFQKK